MGVVEVEGLTDVDLLDVCNELAERLEVKSAAPEPAGVGKERSSGDSCHGRGCIGNEAAAAGIYGETAGGQRWNSWRGKMASSRLVSDPHRKYAHLPFSIKAQRVCVFFVLFFLSLFKHEFTTRNVFCSLNHQSESEVQQRCKTKDMLSIILTCSYPKANFAQLFIKCSHNLIDN